MIPECPPLPPNIISLCNPWLPKNGMQGHFSIYCRLFPPGASSNSLRNLLEVSCNIFHTIIYLRNLLESTLVTLTGSIGMLTGFVSLSPKQQSKALMYDYWNSISLLAS